MPPNSPEAELTPLKEKLRGRGVIVIAVLAIPLGVMLTIPGFFYACAFASALSSLGVGIVTSALTTLAVTRFLDADFQRLIRQGIADQFADNARSRSEIQRRFHPVRVFTARTRPDDDVEHQLLKDLRSCLAYFNVGISGKYVAGRLSRGSDVAPNANIEIFLAHPASLHRTNLKAEEVKRHRGEVLMTTVQLASLFRERPGMRLYFIQPLTAWRMEVVNTGLYLMAYSPQMIAKDQFPDVMLYGTDSTMWHMVQQSLTDLRSQALLTVEQKTFARNGNTFPFDPLAPTELLLQLGWSEASDGDIPTLRQNFDDFLKRLNEGHQARP